MALRPAARDRPLRRVAARQRVSGIAVPIGENERVPEGPERTRSPEKKVRRRLQTAAGEAFLEGSRIYS